MINGHYVEVGVKIFECHKQIVADGKKVVCVWYYLGTMKPEQKKTQENTQLPVV